MTERNPKRENHEAASTAETACISCKQTTSRFRWLSQGNKNRHLLTSYRPQTLSVRKFMDESENETDSGHQENVGAGYGNQVAPDEKI